ncbi:craniofacial development protein 1-like [Pyrus ussuriensis x Pyrus communis]|uniref:Craniofacial development protein 1-like n=1 Tax=Pyrus ussuriensis x Pyrus communis TaxID=2448454 RepID=A0A5N5HI16_9ROSA|nr:craniofacial development protein 1-like [Pyrus ussuriensis x Pyrus communis]
MATTRSAAAAAALGASSSGNAGEKDTLLVESTNGAAPFPGLETKQEQTESPKEDALQKGSSASPNSSSDIGVQDKSNDKARRLVATALVEVKDAAVATSGRRKVEEVSEKAKAPASSGVDAFLEQIKKKPKLSVLDKTKKDWGEFKEEKGLEEELESYKKSSNQYLDKVNFLQRADCREFEREGDAQLAVQAKGKPDMREDP